MSWTTTVSRTKTVSGEHAAAGVVAESAFATLLAGDSLAELAGAVALLAGLATSGWFFLAFSSSRILSTSLSRLVRKSSIYFWRRVLLLGRHSRE